MKRILFLTTMVVALFFGGCEKYDDSALTNRIDNLEERVKTLEELCRQMNTNISSLQTIVSALQNNDYVTGVAPITKNGETIGYTITFTKSQPITIYHGENGKDGQNGTNGVDGKDGSTPVIGVKMDDDGIYYWTLNGEWLTDENGNKIKAVGTDGQDGADGKDGEDGADGKDGQNGTNGADGKDGITPQLKIEEGYWFISYDNGATWTQLGKATGEDGKDGSNGQDGTNGTNGVDGDSFFQSVTQDENNVYIVLADGTEITIPKQTALNISFSATSGIACMPGKSVSISYTISGGDDKTSVEALGDGGWSATVKATSKSEGAIVVTAPEQATTGKVIVLVSDGRGDVIMRSLNFEEGVLSGIEEAYETDWEACTLRVKLQTNLDYTVEIPAEAQSWLSVAESRATLRNETLTFSLTENPDETPRSASVKLMGNSGDVLQSFTIIQKQQPSDDYIVFADAIVKAVCVEKYDTNGDGEISNKEASKVTDIPGNFFGNYAGLVKTFDELQYFVNVHRIDSSAFSGCSSLTNITIPESVTVIGPSAFNGCSRIKSIALPGGVTWIGDRAFYYCSSLTSITISEGVTSIGGYAFYGCKSLTSITIPEGVTSIGGQAFYGCSSLTTITIPESVTAIGDWAFQGCSSLKSVYITNIEKWSSMHFKLNGDNPFFYGAALYLNGELVTEYTYADGVLTTGNAFAGCTSIRSIILPSGLVAIDSNAFDGCSSLTCITIPEGVTEIGNSAFYNCSSLTDITIPEGVTLIGDYAFKNCSSLTSITIPEGVTSIGEGTFDTCSSLTSITIPEGVTLIGDYAFAYCSSMTSITIPEGVTSIGMSAFRECSSLTSITIPEGVTSIGEGTFDTCSSLTSITIPEGVTLIGDYAFKNCSSMTSITIPEGVTSIGEEAFRDCSSLTSITIPEGVTEIGDSALQGCSSLTSITIPESVTSIGTATFAYCSSMTSITIPESVTLIGYYAFAYCSSLTSITIPEGVTSIVGYAFDDCLSLKKVYCKPTTPPNGDRSMFRLNASGRKIYVPASDDDSIINAYKTADYWSDYADAFEEYEFE